MQAEGPDTRDRAGNSRAVRSVLNEVPRKLVVAADNVRSAILKVSAPRFPISRSDQSFEFPDFAT